MKRCFECFPSPYLTLQFILVTDTSILYLSCTINSASLWVTTLQYSFNLLNEEAWIELGLNQAETVCLKITNQVQHRSWH